MKAKYHDKQMVTKATVATGNINPNDTQKTLLTAQVEDAETVANITVTPPKSKKSLQQ